MRAFSWAASVVASTALSLGLLACKRSIGHSDLVGNWYVVSDSTTRTYLGTVNGHLELAANGHFNAVDVPCLIVYMSRPDGQCEGSGPVSGNGSWALKGNKSLVLTFAKQKNGSQEIGNPVETDFMIGGSNPPYLYKWVNDPDSGEAYRITKDGK